MILDLFSLAGKKAVVTGVSTGLGSAIAVGLAEAGADIIGIYHNSTPIDVQKSIENIGRNFIGIQADLGDTASIAHVTKHVIDRADHVDILVNNAGIIRRQSLLEFTEQDWDDVMNVNLKSMFLLSQQIGRHMVQRKIAGKIINIASMLSFQGGIRVPSYTASKHGVLGLTRIFANELAYYQINVNAIAPGYMITANTKALREDAKRNAEIVGRIPAGRWGAPEDLQGAAVFLASSASNYMQGTVLAVDGGWLSR